MKIKEILSKRRTISWKTEYDTLALYNSEVCRGLIHTDEYKAKMELIQIEYDEHIRDDL